MFNYSQALRGFQFGTIVTLTLLTHKLPAFARSLNVVATIKPIHSLASSILDGVTTPKLLLNGANSPHSYALKPSDAERLNNADIIIRVSPNLETFLNRTLENLPGKTLIIDLDKTKNLVLMPVRENSNFEAHHHEGEVDHDDDIDVHFWLTPQNAILIADRLVDEFSAIDPEHKQTYHDNGNTLKGRLSELDRNLAVKFGAVAGKPLIVFHDVTQYLEKRYGLDTVGAITVSPERQPGAQRLKQVKDTITRLGAVCVFSEPQFQPKLVDTLIEGTTARKGVFDEIGVATPEGKDQYIAFMMKNADDIVSCLSPSN